MKLSEMNKHQKSMYDLMNEATSEFIGGNENTLQDYEDDTEEYKMAKQFLEMGHNQMKQFFYDYVMRQCKNGEHNEHAKFAGKEFLLERIETRLTKWGY